MTYDTCLSPYAIVDAPNCGGRVPVDTAPGPAPVYRALKNPPLTMSEHCNCGTNAVFCTPNLTASVVAHNGHATTSLEFNELQLWELGCLLHVCTRELHVLHVENLCGKRTKGNSICATTGVSTTLSKEDDEPQLRDLD